MEFSKMQGITEHHRREVGVNLTGGKTNAVEICEKILGAPSLDELLAKFRSDKGLGVADPCPPHVEVYTTERKRIEEDEPRDETIVED